MEGENNTLGAARKIRRGEDTSAGIPGLSQMA